jgi:hypothetical protein
MILCRGTLACVGQGHNNTGITEQAVRKIPHPLRGIERTWISQPCKLAMCLDINWEHLYSRDVPPSPAWSDRYSVHTVHAPSWWMLLDRTSASSTSTPPTPFQTSISACSPATCHRSRLHRPIGVSRLLHPCENFKLVSDFGVKNDGRCESGGPREERAPFSKKGKQAPRALLLA